jgi:hypothetical protein
MIAHWVIPHSIVNGIKTVKMAGLEEFFLTKLLLARKQEMAAMVRFNLLLGNVRCFHRNALPG